MLNNRGQSLLEVILAMSIFALLAAAMVSMSTGGFITLEQGGEQTEAQALAQEGLEAVRAIRDRAWNELRFTTSSVFVSGVAWALTGEGTTETIGDYTRTISFADVCRDENDEITDCPGSYLDVHSKKVTSAVIWQVREGVTNTVQEVAYLTNWQTKLWPQTDWFGGKGQNIWSNSTRYSTGEDVIDNSVGEVTLAQTTDISASTTWPFELPENYTYSTSLIAVADGFAQLVGTAGGSGETLDDGFEYTIDDSYNWSFTTTSNYIYDTNSIEITSGMAQLKAEGGTIAIYPISSYSAPGVQSWNSFIETAVKNGGEIYYQLSNDNGATWQYWTGSAWDTAGVANYNTASVVNTSIFSFSTSSEQIKFRAFLTSDGSQQVQLDNLVIGFTPSTPVWSFSTWDVGGEEVTPSGAIQISGGDSDSYAEISVLAGNNDEVGGYWQQSFTTTEENPQVTIDFDYKAFVFNGIPNFSQIRVYLDMTSGDPVNQIGTIVNVAATGDWTAVPQIDASSLATTPGTYYLKLAYWLETPSGEGAGPFTVGFDNVNLVWQAASYDSNKPVISNSSSFMPTALNSWTGFVETAVKNGGEIYYQLSNDDGATWQYWDGDSWELAEAEDYNTASVVNSAILYFDTTAKKFMFKAFLASDGTQLVKLDNIDLTYNVASVTYYGNRFIVSSVDGVGSLSNSAYTISLRFTATNSKEVSALRFYLQEERGTSPTYRYGLQADNEGEPSGIWLGNNNQGYGDYQATATGWQTITLNENVSLNQDTVYHLVIEHQTGTINGGNNIELRRSQPLNLLHAFDGSADRQSNILFSEDSGASWLIQNHQPIYILEFSDGSYEGNPYETSEEHQIYGANYFGQQFTPAKDTIISSVGINVSENDQGPEADLILSLYNVTDNLLLATTTLTTLDQITNGVYAWQEFYFTSPLTLTAGKIYRIYISSPEADETVYYIIRSESHLDDFALNSINYGYISSFYVVSTDGGSSWDTSGLNQDLAGFRFQQTIFSSLGYIISSAFNEGSPTAFTVIEWDQETPSCSPNCEVKLQIKTAPDNEGVPGVWSATWSGPQGEDGDETDYFTKNTGELINPDNNQQWIRYKASLFGDSINTPTLQKTRIYYH